MTNAAQIDYAAKTPTDWTNSVTPGETDDAIDQLASRTKSIESDYVTVADALIIDRETNVVVSTSTALFNVAGLFSIPANVLGTERAVAFKIYGDYVNNSGSNSRIKIRIIVGSTIVYDSGNSPAISSEAETKGWELDGMVWADGATNAQRVGFKWKLSDAGSAPSTGYGVMDNASIGVEGGGTAAEDSTESMIVQIQLRHTTADANITWQAFYMSARLV